MKTILSYEIHIGSVIDGETFKSIPDQVIKITEDQFKIVEMFADLCKDENLTSIYKINNCKFKMLAVVNIFKI